MHGPEKTNAAGGRPAAWSCGRSREEAVRNPAGEREVNRADKVLMTRARRPAP